MTLGNPTSVASTRSLRFGAFVIVANLLLAAASIAALFFIVDSTRLPEMAVVLDSVKFLVVGGLAAMAIRSGVLGLRETADGSLRRRGWAIAGIVIGAVFGALTAGSLIATTVLALV
ncbi:MAG: hypothetical protein KF761_12085 [Salinibacterium sp.]|nr:hypothetical protein [Salinibacterium sp.]